MLNSKKIKIYDIFRLFSSSDDRAINPDFRISADGLKLRRVLEASKHHFSYRYSAFKASLFSSALFINQQQTGKLTFSELLKVSGYKAVTITHSLHSFFLFV